MMFVMGKNVVMMIRLWMELGDFLVVGMCGLMYDFVVCDFLSV